MDKGRIRATTIISQVTSCHGRRWEKILKFRVFECFDPYFMGYCCGIDQYHFVVRNSWYFELWINYQGNNLVVRGKKTIKKKKPSIEIRPCTYTLFGFLIFLCFGQKTYESLFGSPAYRILEGLRENSF